MIEPLVSIKIYAPNGKAYYSDAAQTSTDFPVTDSCERSAKLMGDDYVRLVFKSADKVTFAAFSYIEYGGQTFFLKEQYIPTPNGCMKDASGVSSAYYSYDVKFVSVGNMLSKATCYRHVVVNGTDGGEWDEPEITLNGTLETMYVIVMGAIQQYCKRIEDSDCAHFRTLLATIPANGLTKVGGVTSPNTEKVKLTAGTELVSFSFQGDNIANVCTTIANSYTDDDKDTEWYITEDSSHSLILHFAKCEDTDSVTAGSIPQYSDYTMENTSADKDLKPYRTGGLIKVEYAQEWSSIAQTIVPFGSERNMSGVWRKDTDAETQMVVTFGKRLRLDKSHSVEVANANGTKTTYTGAYAVKNRKGETVILQVNAQGGVTNPDVSTGIEEVKFFDDIYPQCHFRVTSVSVRNKKQDDDIVPEYTIEAVPITSTKEQLVANGFYPLTIEEATTLSVRFESGLLNGREFEIANKTHKDADATTYSLKFTIVADGSLEDGTLIPSGNFIPKGDDTKGEGKGDEFALFNMKMPQEYVELAQQELAQKAYDELIDLQETRPEVKCTTDPVHFDGELYFGQVMAIKSELFGGADNEFISRVISFSHKLTTPASVSFSLASAIMQGVLSEMNNAISDITSVTGDLGQRAINLSRRGWRDASEVADMLDSITAEMMLVGNEKYQFAFTSGISCVNNTTADSSGVVHFRGLKITYGTLQHTQEPYINYANKGVWELPSTTPLLTTDHNGETLNADTPYYLYAVVADDGNAARYELWGNNEDSRADDEAYLLMGVLSSEFADNGVAARVFSRTNGYTAIEGGTITTEQIQDAGRNLIIDFQSNPPRIIARNKAEIIGNIRFKASDSQTAEEQLKALGLLAEDAQSTADSAVTAAAAAQAEAVAVRGEYQAAISAEEQARNSAIAGVQSSIGSLQSQIDGEVTAWFLKGVPTLTNSPAVDWTDDNEKTRHIGDTYTNMNTYEEDSENAGKSWRFCKGDGEDDTTTGWHWHLIADSDAVKALVEAGKAQSTADGKSTTFIVQPSNYSKGDLWILQTDKDHTAGKKGDILTANADSATYVASHWSKEVKYTDDTAATQAQKDAATAKTAADNAKSVADAATTRLDDWAKDGVISPTEKQGIKDEIARIDADKTQITNGYTQYSLGTPTAYNTAYTNYRAVLVTLSATTPENITIPSDFSTKQTAYYTARTTALNAISTKAESVAQTYAKDAAQSALDNLQIGGRNLLRGTQALTIGSGDWYTGTWRKSGAGTIANTAITNSPVAGCTQGITITTSSSQCGIAQNYFRRLSSSETGVVSFKAGDTLCFSVWVKPSAAGVKCRIHAFNDNARSSDPLDGMGDKSFTLVAGWQRIWYSGTKAHDTTYEYGDSVGYVYCSTYNASIEVCCPKLEFGNKPTDWTPAPEDVEAEITESKTYAKGLVDTLGTTLQNQIDGVVDSYFMEGAPTTSNAPAKDWTTDELKARHEGDTYTDITKYVSDTETPTAGHSWRWCKGTGDSPATTWHWHEIADSDAVRALQNAAKAQDTADGKRRVFVTTPYPPYDIGDLWAQGSTDGSDILKCKVARASGNYVASDWESASSALRAAGDAQAAADAAKTTLANIASDSVLTSQEKCSVRTEWASIQAEFEKHTANAKACWGDNPETDSTLAKDELWYSGYDNVRWTIIEFDEKVVLQKISAIAPTRLWYKNQITSTQGNFGDDYSTKFTYPFTWTLNCDGIPIANSKYYAAQQIAMFFKESEDKDAVQHYISVYPKKQQYIHQINQVEIVQNTDGTYTTTVTITGYYEDPVYAIYIERYNALKDYLENTAKLNEDSDTAITMQTYGSVKVNPFTKAFSDYYAASIELQNAIAARVAELEAQAAIDNMEVGGENLCGSPTASIIYSTTNVYINSRSSEYYKCVDLGVQLAANKNYVASNGGCTEEITKSETGEATTQTIPDEFAGSYLAVIAYDGQQRYEYMAAFDWCEVINVAKHANGWALKLFVVLGGKDITVRQYPTISLPAATSKSSYITESGNKVQFTYKSGSTYVTPSAFTVAFKDSGTGFEYNKSLIATTNGSLSFEFTCGTLGTRLMQLQFPYQSTTYGAVYMLTTAFTSGYKYRVKVDYYTPTTSAGAYCVVTILQLNPTVTLEGDAARSLLIDELLNDTIDTDDIDNLSSFRWSNTDYSGDDTDYYKSISEIQVQTGTCPTKFQAYTEHLTNALKGSTDVSGGLLMTNVLMLKNESNKVTAGMSGLSGTSANPEKVLLWGGGDYYDASNAANSSTYAKKDGTPITTLLKKDGTGKIGIFKIDDESVMVENGGVRTVITSGSVQDFADANNIGYTYYDKEFTSAATTAHDCVIMERNFDGTQTGTVKIDNLSMNVSYYGTQSQSAFCGAYGTLSIIVVYNGGSLTATILSQKISDTLSGGASNPASISIPSFSQTYAKIKSFKIVLSNAQTTYGSIGLRFNAYAGTAGNSKACVLANDGMMLSSGDGNRFIIKPTDDAMSIIADLPIVRKKDDVDKLVIGQLFTDDSGIVRRYSYEDESYKNDLSHYRSFANLYALRKGYEAGVGTITDAQKKGEILDFTQFFSTRGNFNA